MLFPAGYGKDKRSGRSWEKIVPPSGEYKLVPPVRKELQSNATIISSSTYNNSKLTIELPYLLTSSTLQTRTNLLTKAG